MSGKKFYVGYLVVFLTFLNLQTLTEAQAAFKTATHYTAQRLGIPHAVRGPRGVIDDREGNLLIISRESSHISILYEEGTSVKTLAIVEAEDLRLNHGIAYNNGYLYASSNDTVFRWGYRPGQRSKITQNPEIVVSGIPNSGDYQTRSLLIDGSGYLYVSVGTSANVDVNPRRAQIRRFNLTESIPAAGFQYDAAQVFVKGVRNAVGLAADSNNDVWGVDCGADELYREDLGGDIHNTNPADELIKFEQEGFYGYPYCWTVGQLDKYKQGDQLAWPNPDFEKEGHNDAWCKNTNNNRPPTLSLPAHNAPLGIVFYDGVGCDVVPGAFPCFMKGDAFITFHGSVNAEPPTGYKVVRLPFNPKTGRPTGEIEDILYNPNPKSCLYSPTTCLRPVDLVFNQNGRLIVTSDASDEIFSVSYTNKGRFTEIIERSLHIPGVISLVLVILFTIGLIGLVSYKYCFVCRKTTKEVPYVREQI